MRDNWKKILIFAGLIILQIGLAYGLVTFILPPAKVTNFASNNTSNKSVDKVESATISAAPADTFADVDEGSTELPKDEPDSTISEDAEIDSNAVNASVMIEGMADFLEDELTEKDLKNAFTFSIDDLIINPAETRGTRYVVLSITAVAKGKNIDSRLEAKMPAIKDALNTLISRKTVLWLSDINNRPFLREEIKMMLETIIGDVTILRLYFTKYIFQ